MSDAVEGEWKTFEIKLATNKDVAEISKHVREFFLRDEPLNTLSEWTEENALAHDKMVELVITHGLSLVIREKATGEVAGVNIIIDSRLPGIDTIFYPENPPSIHMEKLLVCFERIDEATGKVFKELFPSDFYAEIFISSVADKYRGCGLATEMYVRTMTLLKLRGFPVVKSVFSSPGTRAIAKKMGFTELARLKFREFLDENGHLLYPNAGDGDEDVVSESAKFV